MADPIAPDVAEVELQRIIAFWEVDPEGEGWEANKKKLLFAIQKGRISLDPEKGVVRQRLMRPIQTEKEGTVEEFVYHEPTAADLKVMDKYGKNEDMAKTIHLAARMSSQPLGIVDRMASRDVSVMGALASLFF